MSGDSNFAACSGVGRRQQKGKRAFKRWAQTLAYRNENLSELKYMRRRGRLAYFITSERWLAHRSLAPGKAEWRWFSSADAWCRKRNRRCGALCAVSMFVRALLLVRLKHSRIARANAC